MTNSVAIGVAYSDQAISSGTVDGSPVGATTASTGAFTTLSASGAATLNGNVAAGNATTDTVAFYGVSGTTQRASAVQATLTYTVLSNGFGFTTSAQFIAAMAALDEIMATLTALGLWKGAA